MFFFMNQCVSKAMLSLINLPIGQNFSNTLYISTVIFLDIHNNVPVN